MSRLKIPQQFFTASRLLSQPWPVKSSATLSHGLNNKFGPLDKKLMNHWRAELQRLCSVSSVFGWTIWGDWVLFTEEGCKIADTKSSCNCQLGKCISRFKANAQQLCPKTWEQFFFNDSVRSINVVRLFLSTAQCLTFNGFVPLKG